MQNYRTQLLQVNPADAETAVYTLNSRVMYQPITSSIHAVPSLWLALWLLIAGPLHADDSGVDPLYRGEVEREGFEYDDSQDIPWIENETEVLAMPRPEDLRRVELETLPDGLELLIDGSRVTVGSKDRVVRAWLWVRSDPGAESGTFEGFRCATREYKVYAYANPRRDPPVRKAKRASWLSAKKSATPNYRAELLSDFFCGMRGTRDADDIRRAIAGTFGHGIMYAN